MSKQLTQWISDYDSGKVMESVSMGGLGDGYEIAIQDCAVEIIRGLQGIEVPEKDEDFRKQFESVSNEVATRLDKKHGFSGAQVGAAKNIAAVFWRKTPEVGIQTMKDQDAERIIHIQKGTNETPTLIKQ